MLRRVILVVILVLWPAGSLGLAALAAEMPESATIMLPKGDPAAGRATFLHFKCNTCHMVSGPQATGMALPVTTVPAPLLNAEIAKQAPGRLVTSIIAPSHTVSPIVAEETEGELSPMGDFTEVMTVRQLIDLVAFLRSVEESPAVRTTTKRASSR